LAEPEGETEATYAAIMEALNPSDELAKVLAGAVADRVIGQQRLGRYETLGLDAISARHDDHYAQWWHQLAAMYRNASLTAAELVSTGPVHRDDVEALLGLLNNHPAVDDAFTGLPRGATINQLVERVLQLAAENLNMDPGELEAWLDSQATKFEADAQAAYEYVIPDAAEAAIESDFWRRFIAAEAHNDRMLQRALDRYYTHTDRVARAKHLAALFQEATDDAEVPTPRTTSQTRTGAAAPQAAAYESLGDIPLKILSE
jgi:hypothetical protein